MCACAGEVVSAFVVDGPCVPPPTPHPPSVQPVNGVPLEFTRRGEVSMWCTVAPARPVEDTATDGADDALAQGKGSTPAPPPPVSHARTNPCPLPSVDPALWSCALQPLAQLWAGCTVAP